jgi:broad specificity phosphatase PhoE
VSPDALLAELPPERRAVVGAVRDLVRAALPDGYEERVSGRMLEYVVPLARYPTTYNGQPLAYVALAAQKHHYALYLVGAYADPARAAALRDGFARAGKKLDMGKSCVRFKRVDDLAVDAVREAVAALTPDAFIALHEASRAGARRRLTGARARRLTRRRAAGHLPPMPPPPARGRPAAPAPRRPASAVRTLAAALAAALPLALPAAARGQPRPAAPGATAAAPAAAPALVIVVRHAEKAAAPGDDPPLSPEGEARARALAEALAGADVGAIVVTPRRRTADTAAPLAAARRLTPRSSCSAPPARPARRARRAVADAARRHPGRVVVVVGHSNTVPAVVAALGGPRLPDLCDASYATMFVVRQTRGGSARRRARHADAPRRAPWCARPEAAPTRADAGACAPAVRRDAAPARAAAVGPPRVRAARPDHAPELPDDRSAPPLAAGPPDRAPPRAALPRSPCSRRPAAKAARGAPPRPTPPPRRSPACTAMRRAAAADRARPESVGAPHPERSPTPRRRTTAGGAARLVARHERAATRRSRQAGGVARCLRLEH